ncbi:MAG: methyltransferase domain-containing protein [Acidobacteriota bacterium]
MVRSNRNAALGTFALVVLLALGGVGYRLLQPDQVGSEGARLVQEMGVHPGQTLADVGAGDGEWSLLLASTVGPSGKIYSTEVDGYKVHRLQQRSRAAEFGNIEVIRGNQEKTGLKADCCDGILLRRVYHHFEHPHVMLADLRRALKPSGVLAVIDFNPTGRFSRSNVPSFRHGHGVPIDTATREIQAAGFEEVRRVAPWTDWDATYLLLFRRPSAPSRDSGLRAPVAPAGGNSH